MKFIEDKELGYRLDTHPSLLIDEMLRQHIAEQYQEEKKRLTIAEFNEQLECTIEGVMKGRYSAWIDTWGDGDAILHLEVDYGFGNLDFGITGVEI